MVRKILLVAATQAEIQPFINKEVKAVEVLITGVGMLATAYQLGRALATKHYDLVIHAGIAGSYQLDWPKGTVVEVVSEQIHDLGAENAEGGFLSVFKMGLIDGENYPYQGNKLINKGKTNYKKAAGLTVNRVTGERKKIDQTYAAYQADIETMEGAAGFYACLMEKVPLISLRSISNYVAPRNRAAWDIPLAIKTLNAAILEVTAKFPKPAGRE